MGYVGDYDPVGFDQLDPGTWPTPAPYSPGDWWYLVAAGTINGVDVEVGDRVFPIGTGRLYGEGLYGDEVYGGAPPDPPWPADDPYRVRWRAQAWTNAPAWQRPPAPGSGCAFGDTGWRIVIETFLINPAARLYGEGLYGDDVYGDDWRGPVEDWVDSTRPAYGIVARWGADDGSPSVDVDSARFDVLDQLGDVFPILAGLDVDKSRALAPGVATPVRVALLDPNGDPWPIFTGRIERVDDRHETRPRLVSVDAFGMAADLAVSRDVARGTETAAERLDALVESVGYSWGVDPWPTPAPTLRPVDRTNQARIRDEIDRAALSAGWIVSTDPLGVLNARPWPDTGTGGAVTRVCDRLDVEALPAVEIERIADTGEVLNAAYVESVEVEGHPTLYSSARDVEAIARFRERTDAMGFPRDDLSAQQGDLDALARSVVDRFGRIVNRVTSIEVDTRQDERWLDVLARARAGDLYRVETTEPVISSVDTVLVGVEYRVTPGRIRATLKLSTITPTL